MAGKPVISAIGADGLEIGFDLLQQTGKMRAIMGVCLGQLMRQNGAGFGAGCQVQLALEHFRINVDHILSLRSSLRIRLG